MVLVVPPCRTRVLALAGAGLAPLPNCASARRMRASAVLASASSASSAPLAWLGRTGTFVSCIALLCS